ncbi:MAG TPA: glycine cleavage system aminomethyltransferase GcvT [Burkholderiales bacterium]|jgi:aminomethyltransferase|nr:glycine cleavage system aminomethyltransferase GcvT [Burkholderiales bacterium]
MRRTPLFDAHRAAGARMVEFAGWEMPLHYGSQIEEHHAVRRAAGVFDISHMLAADVAGAEAKAFLRRALANDVERLKAPGKALYSCLLAEDGGVLDDLIVYFVEPGRYRMVLNAATAQADLAWLGGLAPAGVRLAPRPDLAMLAVQGPRAREKFWDALPEFRAASEELASFCSIERNESFIARTGYTGEDGFELMLPARDAPGAWRRLCAAGIGPCGLGARDTLRLEAGMNLYGADMDAAVTPFESGLAWTVSLEGERDFVGRAALERRSTARQRLGLVLEERAGVLRAHQEVRTERGEGVITSGSFAPTLNASIALARLPAACAPGERVEVAVRGKRLAARLVRPPFVRHGKILV